MATILEDLKITSVDFVDRGANPDAYLCLRKGLTSGKVVEGDGEEKENDDLESGTSQENPEQGKSGEENSEQVGKGRDDVVMTENLGMDDSVWKSLPPLVRKAFEDLEVEKSALAKQSQDLKTQSEALTKQSEGLEALRKGLELEKLTEVCKKYEPLGQKAEELAEKLSVMKGAGGTVYDDFVSVLDGSLDVLEKSGIFKEAGKNTTVSASGHSLLAKAEEISKRDGISEKAAFVKAYEENPELAEEYEKNYGEGG